MVTVQKTEYGLDVKLAPDRRYVPRCGALCERAARYCGTCALRRFRNVSLWGINVHTVRGISGTLCSNSSSSLISFVLANGQNIEGGLSSLNWIWFRNTYLEFPIGDL